MIEVINRLLLMKKWSDRLGSDEIAEIDELMKILMKEISNNKKAVSEITKLLK